MADDICSKFEFTVTKKTIFNSLFFSLISTLCIIIGLKYRWNGYEKISLIIGIVIGLMVVLIWILIGLTYIFIYQGDKKIIDLLSQGENSSTVELSTNQLKEMALYGYTRDKDGKIIAVKPPKVAVSRATEDEQQLIRHYEKMVKGE